ncbi:MAG TPA: DoxX family protein [Longimicrobium sp.]|jgi:uncharacterized membrane protein YphA (DoxX/SURF4 family)
MSATLTTAAPAATSKPLNIALWVLQIAAAAMLGMAGFQKLSSAPEMVAAFQEIGMGQWFRYLTGALEVGGAILLLIPALSGVGALILSCVMLGAVATHLFVVGGSPMMALILLVVVGFIAYGRRDRTLRLLGR